MLNNQNHRHTKHNSPVPWDQAWEPLFVPRPSLGRAVSSDWLSPSPQSAVLVAAVTPLALSVLPLASPQSAVVCPWIPVNSIDLVMGDYYINPMVKKPSWDLNKNKNIYTIYLYTHIIFQKTTKIIHKCAKIKLNYQINFDV